MLTCDICGGELVMDSSGEFGVCENCGMKHTKERMKIKAKQSIDEKPLNDSKKIDQQVINWSQIANTAFENSSYQEAYTYYCKIAEVDTSYWLAAYRKGICLGWESTLDNIRMNEVLGGIIEGTKLLLADKKQTDSLKASGTMIMALELHNWTVAICDASVKQANEYAPKLVKSAKDFFEQQTLLSEILQFNINMLNQHVYEYCEDKKGFQELYKEIKKLSETVIYNLSASFKIKTGVTYDNIWNTYTDVYQTVVADSKGNISKGNLERAKNNLVSNINRWKTDYDKKIAEKVRKEREEKRNKFWKENPDIYEKYKNILREEKETADKKNQANKEKTNAINKLKSIEQKYTDTVRNVADKEREKTKLERKIFGRKKAAEKIAEINAEINRLHESLKHIEGNKIEAKLQMKRFENNYNEWLERYRKITEEKENILRHNNLN